MRVIKLDAIDSTNEFLKQLDAAENLENFTIVTAENQTKGKGQMGSVWDSDAGKNLIMSILLKNTIIDVNAIFTLNIAVALAIYKGLETVNIPALSIKWPNDILVEGKKLAGILIENQITKGHLDSSIVGFGLNVNQPEFSTYPWEATSMINLLGVETDLDQVLETYRRELEIAYELTFRPFDELYTRYSSSLYGLSSELTFFQGNKKVQGRLSNVDASGRLVLNINGSLVAFASGEIRLARTSSG